MKCENCEAFAPNFKDEAYTSGCEYKCLLHGNSVRPEDEACHRFVIDPIQKGGAQ